MHIIIGAIKGAIPGGIMVLLAVFLTRKGPETDFILAMIAFPLVIVGIFLAIIGMIIGAIAGASKR
jgi:hypothetical protein